MRYEPRLKSEIWLVIIETFMLSFRRPMTCIGTVPPAAACNSVPEFNLVLDKLPAPAFTVSMRPAFVSETASFPLGDVCWQMLIWALFWVI